MLDWSCVELSYLGMIHWLIDQSPREIHQHWKLPPTIHTAQVARLTHVFELNLSLETGYCRGRLNTSPATDGARILTTCWRSIYDTKPPYKEKLISLFFTVKCVFECWYITTEIEYPQWVQTKPSLVGFFITRSENNRSLGYCTNDFHWTHWKSSAIYSISESEIIE